MRSLRDLAARAAIRYPPKEPQLAVPTSLLEALLEEGFQALIHRAGGVYRALQEIPLTLGTRDFALPSDFRELLEHGIYLSYTPRIIASISRSGGVVTVQTTTAHVLQVGVELAIAGTVPTGDTVFAGTYTVTTVADTTHFTYDDDQDDDTGAGGTVECASTWRELALDRREDLALPPGHEATADVPSYYFLADSLTLRLDCPSDGSYPCLYLEYDAEAPNALTPTATLPLPAYLEAGLLGYAAANAGLTDPKLGLALFEDAVATWRGARSDREQASTRESRW